MNAGLAVDLPQLAAVRRRRHRPVPHRTAIHGGVALSRGPRSRKQLYRSVLKAAGGKTGHLPHARYRRRQGAALFGDAVQEENPALGWRAIRLSLDRPGLLPHADPGAAEGIGRARAARSCCRWSPRCASIARRAQSSTARVAILSRLRPPAAGKPQAWRDDRGAGAAVAARRADGRGRFRLGRLQRPVPVRHGGRPRQSAHVEPLRSACRGRSCACCAQIVARRQQHGKPVTLCGELAGRPLPAMALIGHRLPLAFDVAGLHRPGQGDAARTRCRQAFARCSCRRSKSRSAGRRSANCCIDFADSHGIHY